MEFARAEPMCVGWKDVRKIRFHPGTRRVHSIRGLFFNTRPLRPDPIFNSLVVAFPCSGLRTLATPAHLSKDAPHMPRMIIYMNDRLKHISHSFQRPQRSAVAVSFRAALQGLCEYFHLLWLKFGFASRTSGSLEPLTAVLLPCLVPTAAGFDLGFFACAQKPKGGAIFAYSEKLVAD